MHRKSWFLVAAAVAVFALTGTAAATGGRQSLTAFEKATANVDRTPQARATRTYLNFGMETDVPGFFALDVDETTFWASATGAVPEIRGNYIVDKRGVYHLDLASSVTLNSTGKALTIIIRPDAVWFSPGHGTTPVTTADYAYTYNVIMDPRNPVASTTGYDQINPSNPYTILSQHQIVFHFTKPFVYYKDLFGYILPSDYLPSVSQMGANGGSVFNEVWRDCVCTQTLDNNGNVVDGDPVTDGPFYMQAYTQGQGVVLHKTPAGDWYGHDPALTQVNFDLVAPGAPEVNALQGGQLDAAFVAGPAAQPLWSDPNFGYDAGKSFVQERIDFNEANPLLAHAWMREAIALGIDRRAVIKAVYYDSNIVPPGSVPQLNSPEYVFGKYSVAPYDYFRTWNFDETHALSILAAHCTGGPTSPSDNNTKVWQCADGPAEFQHWTTTLSSRVQSAYIYQQELMRIGIKLDINTTSPANFYNNILRGAQTNSCINYDTSPPSPQKCGADTYDTAEWAVVGGSDPSGFNEVYECYNAGGSPPIIPPQGEENVGNYCKPSIHTIEVAGDNDFTSTRDLHYLKVAKIVSANTFAFPLYVRPGDLLIFHNYVGGMGKGNNPISGPTWNIERWHWR